MIVSLAAYRRPKYLAEALATLDLAASYMTEAMILVTRIDPSPVLDEMRSLLDRGRGTYVTVNEEVKGCAGNTLLVVNDAFQVAHRFGEDYVQHWEEDFVIAPDGLRLSAWIRDTFRDDPSVLAGGISTAHAATPDEYLSVHKSGWFHCQGWSTWVGRWQSILRPVWKGTDSPATISLGQVSRGGWAGNFNDNIFPEAGGFQVIPRLSRVKHIGLEGGLHTTPTTFERDLPKVYAADVTIPEAPYYSLAAVESKKP